MKSKNLPTPGHNFCLYLQNYPVETFLKYTQMKTNGIDHHIEPSFAYFLQNHLTDTHISKIFDYIKSMGLFKKSELLELHTFIDENRHKFTLKQKFANFFKEPGKDMSEWTGLAFQFFMEEVYNLFNVTC